MLKSSESSSENSDDEEGNRQPIRKEQSLASEKRLAIAGTTVQKKAVESVNILTMIVPLHSYVIVLCV